MNKLIYRIAMDNPNAETKAPENGLDDVEVVHALVDEDVGNDGDIQSIHNMGDGSSETTEAENAPEDAVVVLKKHTAETVACDSNPNDPNMIASGGCDDRAIIWDIQQKKDLAELDGQGESVSNVAFSHDGKYLAIGSENGNISLMFLQGGAAPQTVLDGPAGAITFLCWHPRGPVLLAGSEDKSAYMWNAAKGLFMMAFIGHEDAVTCGFFTRDGKKVVTAARDKAVRVWNPTTGATLTRIQANQPGTGSTFHGAEIHTLAMGYPNTPLAMIAASGCASGSVYISNIENGQVLVQLPSHAGGVESLSFSPPTFRPLLLASAGADGNIRVRDMEAGVERCVFSHPQVISKIMWHPDKPLLASGSSDGTVCLWNAMTGQNITRLRGHNDYIADFCFAAYNQCIASVSGDGSVRVFDIRPYFQ